jgi:hypothetical protein
MNRATRRADLAKGRRDRVAAFAQRAGTGGFETSLCAAGETRPQDGTAVKNWYLSEPLLHPTCFSCRAAFTSGRRPGGFLCAVASRAPNAGVAVSACCQECWDTKSPATIEQAAIDVMHRQLGARGFADDPQQAPGREHED